MGQLYLHHTWVTFAWLYTDVLALICIDIDMYVPVLWTRSLALFWWISTVLPHSLMRILRICPKEARVTPGGGNSRPGVNEL